VAARSTRSLDLTVITTAEADVVSFFEIEPKRLDADIPWPYNTFIFEIMRGEISLHFSIAPSYGDLALRLQLGDATIYELSAVGIDDLRYNNDSGRETLEIRLRESESLWLRVKPGITITHGVRSEI